jgi:hypothetical protein
MDFFVLVTIVAPLVSLSLHELCHLAFARTSGPISVDVASLVPLRVDIEFDSSPSASLVRLVAIAPLLTGLCLAAGVHATGVWDALEQLEPYYLSYLFVLNWLVFSHVSLADARLALNPHDSYQSTSMTAKEVH